MASFMCGNIIICEILQLDIFNLSTDSQYFLYCVSQFILGFSSFTCYVTSYVLLLEITTSAYSTIVSNFNLYMYIFGELIALALGYFARDWHTINRCVGIYSIGIVFLIVFFLPESPRILVANKQYTEAYKVLENIARMNGKQDALMNEQSFIEHLELNEKKKEQDEEETKIQIEKIQEKTQTVWQYLINPIYNLIKTFLLIYIWISLAINYYGQSLGNLYIFYNIIN